MDLKLEPGTSYRLEIIPAESRVGVIPLDPLIAPPRPYDTWGRLHTREEREIRFETVDAGIFRFERQDDGDGLAHLVLIEEPVR